MNDQATSKLEILFSTPIMPGQTYDYRLSEILEATPTLSDNRRLALANKVLSDLSDRGVLVIPSHQTKVLEELDKLLPGISHEKRLMLLLKLAVPTFDFSRNVLRSTGRPGILEQFVKLHAWCWHPLFDHPGKFTSPAHDPGRDDAYMRLVWTMKWKGGNLRAAREIVQAQYLDRFPNIWFVPSGNPIMTRHDAAQLILTYYQKNRKRLLEQHGRRDQASRAAVRALDGSRLSGMSFFGPFYGPGPMASAPSKARKI